MYLIYSFVILLIGLLKLRLMDRFHFLHPRKMFIYFFLIVQVSGFFLIQIISLFNGGYKFSDKSLNNAALITLFGFIYYLILEYFSYRISRRIYLKLALNLPNFYRFRTVFFTIGFIGLTFYFKNTGFTFFAPGGYQNKNINNVGLGLYRIMMGIGFTYGLIAMLGRTYNPVRFLKGLRISILLGTILFIVIGGGRAASLNLLIISITYWIYHKGNSISFKRIFKFGTVSLISLILLTSIRYKVSFSRENITLILYQLQGSISPVDSLAMIISKFPNQYEWKWDLFLNSFLTLIPRSLWTEKPLQLEIASVFFTNEVLNYGSFLTISTTLFGELYMYGGLIGITLGLLLVIFLIQIFSMVFEKSQKHNSYYLLIILKSLWVFALFRDGLSIAIRDLFLFLIIFLAMGCITQIQQRSK